MAQSDVAGEPAQRTPSGGTDTIGTVGAAPTTGRAAELLTRVSGNAQAGEVTPEAPFTGAPITTLPQASDADVREAFARARQQQSAWAAVPAAERQRVLQRLHDLILDRQQEALDLIQVEAGKARMDAFDEISSSALVAAYYGKHSARLLAANRAAGVIPVLTKAGTLHHPKGVIGVVTPWNYPLALSAMDVLPALAAGNTVVQKSDNQTTLSALWLHELAEEAGLPPSAWQIVPGKGTTVGNVLVDEADYVCFTGSTPTGKQLAGQLAGKLSNYSLELGGKNPMIVLPDADIASAAAGAVTACFSSAGQLCVSVERIYVHEGVRDRFVEEFVRRTEAMRIGAGLDYNHDMGSLTSRDQLESVSAHVTDARERGARVLTGGHARPEIGPLFHEPTIVTDVPADAKLYAAETFGPVVAVYTYRDTDEAIRKANDTTFGLNASVWSASTARAWDAASRIKAGTVNINEGYAATFGTVGLPMGGMKQSGVGRRNGADGLLRYTDTQSIAAQRGLRLRPPRFVPARAWTRSLTASLKLLRRLPRR